MITKDYAFYTSGAATAAADAAAAAATTAAAATKACNERKPGAAGLPPPANEHLHALVQQSNGVPPNPPNHCVCSDGG